MSGKNVDRLFPIVVTGAMLCFAVGIAFEGWAKIEQARAGANSCPCQTAKK